MRGFTTMSRAFRSIPMLIAVGSVLCLLASARDGPGEPPPARIEAFTEHLLTLTDPAFEGRGPGTAGNLQAADYLAESFQQIGLQPAFTDEAGNATFFQPVQVDEQILPEVTVDTASVVYEDGVLRANTDFTPLAFSGSGTASAPLVFVGYSIVSGPGGYLNYATTPNLEGKVAIVLRHEPMFANGTSRWTNDDSWSFAATLTHKVSAAARRGASAVLVVDTPGAENPPLDAPASGIAFGEMTVPVIGLTREAGDRLMRAADAEGRSLLDLRKLADESAVIIDLPNMPEVRVSGESERESGEPPHVGAVLRGAGARGRGS
ncbi:MAG: PA domain-containing protein, partial [Planctomycetota bacterium]